MSASDPGPTVVVGVNGSGPSVRAVAWAAEEARLRGRPLQIVCVLRQGSYTPGPEEADRVLRRARTIARIGSPGGDVRGELRRGDPASVLAELSGGAELLVVGHRRGDGVSGRGLGSTALALALTSASPVVVVRAAAGRPVPDRDRPIVVGVDDATNSGATVEFAVQLAMRRGSELIAVHVWPEHVPAILRRLARRETEPGREAADRLLANGLAGHMERHPDLRMRREVVRGRPAWSLLELSDSAQLIVVGRPGRAGFAGTPFGSCTGLLLRASTCPVAVIPPRPETGTGPPGSAERARGHRGTPSTQSAGRG
jgi:nucleotide-binding universal stress UspA family protein